MRQPRVSHTAFPRVCTLFNGAVAMAGAPCIETCWCTNVHQSTCHLLPAKEHTSQSDTGALKHPIKQSGLIRANEFQLQLQIDEDHNVFCC